MKREIKQIKVLQFTCISLLVLFALCIIVCGVIIGVSYNNVAFANSTNGIVEDNICKLNDLTNSSAQFGVSNGIDTIRIATNNTSYNNGVISNTRTSTGWYAYYLDPSLFVSGNTYTVSFYVSSSNGTFYLGFSNYENGSFSSSSVVGLTGTGVKSHTYAYNSSFNSPVIMFGGSASTSITLEWVKVEKSSSFTGYVKKDYSNYGYNQGYEYGLGSVENIETVLSAFTGTFTGLTSNNVSTYTWSIPNYYNASGWGSLYVNYSNLPVGSIINMHLEFISYGLFDTSNNLTTYSSVNIKFAFGYYNSLYDSPPDYAKTMRLDNSTYDYSFTIDRGGDTLVLYFPTNFNSVINQRTFQLSWFGAREDIDFTTSSIGADIQAQLDNAYFEGQQSGKSIGEATGYTRGYNDALSQYQGASFTDLLGAVFDAPITAIIGKYDSQTQSRIGGLLNFEILGTNISAFVLALLSIGIVLFVLRVFIRGL